MAKLKNGCRLPDAGCFCLKCPHGIIILALIFNLQLNNQFYVKDSCKQISWMCTRQYILMGVCVPRRVWGEEKSAIRTASITGPQVSERLGKNQTSPRCWASIRYLPCSRAAPAAVGNTERKARWGWEKRYNGLRHGFADKSVLAENATCFESVSFQLRALLPAPADA